MLVTSGPFSWPNSRYMTDRIIRPHDIVYVDVYNTTYNGCHICYYRTFSVGKPPQQLVDAYKTALDWLYRAISVIKPGITTRDIAEQWPPCEKDWSDILVAYEDQTAGSNWAHRIGPAFMRTPMNDPVLADPHFVEWSSNRIPLHRMGQPEEMVGAAICMSSDSCSFVNGAVLMSDGGFTAC